MRKEIIVIGTILKGSLATAALALGLSLLLAGAGRFLAETSPSSPADRSAELPLHL